MLNGYTPEGRASMTYPVMCPAPVSPGVQWMVKLEPDLVTDVLRGDPGDPALKKQIFVFYHTPPWFFCQYTVKAKTPLNVFHCR